jgi:hypothetical protein
MTASLVKNASTLLRSAALTTEMPTATFHFPEVDFVVDDLDEHEIDEDDVKMKVERKIVSMGMSVTNLLNWIYMNLDVILLPA